MSTSKEPSETIEKQRMQCAEPSRVGRKLLAVEAQSHRNVDDIVRSCTKVQAGSMLPGWDQRTHLNTTIRQRTDCFRCLPSYGNDLRQQYTLQLALIAKSKMLEFLLSAILKKPITVEKPNPDMWKQIIGAEYALS